MFRCAIYVRVSTEEQAENPEGSIRNQELRLREYVKLKNLMSPFGEVTAVFCDPGVSAKDMNRPAFQKMLRAIERKEINLVLVTELSRLTRSMKDFSLLQEFFKKHSCEFLSLRENFDSSSSTGSLVMNIMATLAEFERKQTAERISNSFHERAKRGLHNGGALPLGYRIDESRPGNLAIVPEEAELVKLVFDTFIVEETLANTAKRLNRDEVSFPRARGSSGRPRGRIWQINMLWTMLKNKSYIGVRVFSDKKGGKNEVKASWEPIIDIDTFERVGRMLAKNRNHKRTHGASRYPYTLSGSIFCKTCGHRLAGRSAHGATTKVAYYEHTHNRKLQANLSRRVNICTSHHRIRATLIEPLVWMDVKEFLTSESFAMDLLTKAKVRSPVDTNKERRVKLEATGKKLVAQVEALAERIGVLPRGLDPAALYMQLEKLQASRDRIMEELSKEVAQEVSDEYVSLESLQEFTKGLRAMLDKGDQNPEIQAAIMRKIVHKIEVLPDGYEIFYHAGLNHYEKELGTTPGSSFFRLDAINEKRLASLSLKRVRSQPCEIFSKKSVTSSTLLLTGGPTKNRTWNGPLGKGCYIHLTMGPDTFQRSDRVLGITIAGLKLNKILNYLTS